MSNVADVRPAKGVSVYLGTKIEEGKVVPVKRTLLYDLNAFAEIEEAFGSIEIAMQALEGGSIAAVRLVLWAGLLHENLDEKGQPTITQIQVGSWVDISQLKNVIERIGLAITSSLPKDQLDEGSKGPLPTTMIH